MVLLASQQVLIFTSYEILDNDKSKLIFSSIAFESLLTPYVSLNIIFKYRNSHLLVFNSFSNGVVYPKRDYFFDSFGKHETWMDYISSYDDNFKSDGRHPYYSHHIHLSNLIYEYLYKNVL